MYECMFAAHFVSFKQGTTKLGMMVEFHSGAG